MGYSVAPTRWAVKDFFKIFFGGDFCHRGGSRAAPTGLAIEAGFRKEETGNWKLEIGNWELVASASFNFPVSIFLPVQFPYSSPSSFHFLTRPVSNFQFLVSALLNPESCFYGFNNWSFLNSRRKSFNLSRSSRVAALAAGRVLMMRGVRSTINSVSVVL